MPPGTAVVGLREAALRQLEEAFEDTRAQQQLQVVALTGDAGSGKTTLLLELRHRLSARDDAPQLGYGRALGSTGTDNARQPVREALRDLMDHDEPEASRRMGRGALLQVLRQSAPAWLGVIPVVGPLVSALASTTDATVAAMNGRPPAPAHALPESVNQQFCTLVTRLAGESPVVLLLDDLHWSDTATADLVLTLTQSVSARPVLLVLAYRPYAGDETLVGHPARALLPRLRRYLPVPEVLLEPLDDDGVADLLLAATGEPPSTELRDWVSSRSGGNPLFVRELLDLLSGRSLLHARQGQLTLTRSGPALEDLPTTLSSVLDERLATLEDDQRSFVDAAAVLGVSFDADQAYRTAELRCDQYGLQLSLGSRGARMIAPDEVRPGRYRFTHPLFVEHLLHCLREADPTCYRVLHSRAAAVLGGHGDTDDVEWLHEMARLHRAAGEYAEAHLYSSLCAESAAASGALPVAVRHAEWAVEMADRLPSSSDRVEARILLGHLQFDSIRMGESLQTLRGARRLVVPADDPDLFARLAAALAGALSGSRLWSECRTVLADALAIEADLDPDVRAQLLMFEGASYLFGQPLDGARSLGLLVRAQQLARGPVMRAVVARHLVLAHLAVGDAPEALRAAELAHRQAAATTSPGLRFQTWLFDAYLRLALLDLDAARRAVAELVALSRRNGIGPMDIHRLTGRIEALAGDLPAAVAGWWNFVEIDLGQAADDATRRWGLTHLQLAVQELHDVRGAPAAVALLSALQETAARELAGGSGVDPHLPGRLQAYAEALRSGEDLAAGAARRGHALTLDATAVAVHSFFVADLAAGRQQWRSRV